MDFKKTLIMPQTEFEMRGNLAKKDPAFIDELSKLRQKIMESKKGELYILHDGPPYANGNIHVGHALNKILKDIVARDQLLRGRPVDWRPGWDTHGLPIENQIQKEGIKLGEVGKEAYLEAAKEYALTQVEKQEEQFKSLNLIADFDNKYVTLDPKFEKAEIEIFHAMLNKGITYQDLKPVYWSWSSETALAEAEIEYEDMEDNSVFVKFSFGELKLVIWTTTPWTLPANVAIAFGKNISYGVYTYKSQRIVVADELAQALETKFEVVLTRVEDFNPANHIGEEATNPLTKKKSKLVWGHHVTTEGGTGLVHIAGGHGLDDFQIVKENNLELVVVMDAKGHMQNSGDFDGMFYLKANKEIIAALGPSLLHHSMVKHSVPIDWRTKKPIVYRATKQWFVSIKAVKNELIENASKAIWLPSWGKDRIIGMTENREDWGISRQRLWGVPIPIIYDSENKPIVDLELQKNIETLFEKEGTLGWHKVEIKDLLPSSIEFHEGMRKETDILDVWFDSGSSHNALGIDQADLYLEGNDQYRGWFNSSLITSTILKGKAPYKKVITHGFVTDAKGNKMSKSIGNTIDPLEVTSKSGSDILRLWAASGDYTDNIKISDDILKQVSKDYMKIRNTIKFMLGNIFDYKGDGEVTSSISKAVLTNISKSWDKINNAFSTNDYVSIIKEIMNQLTSGSIAYYNELAKDITYVKAEGSQERKEAQLVISELIKFVLFSLATIIPMTVEEAYKFYNPDNKGSILFEEYPEFKSYDVDFNEFKSIRDLVNKSVEELKEQQLVKRIQEVEINIQLPENLQHWSDNLADLLLVAKANVTTGELKVTSKVFEGHKCDRCWKMFDMINSHGVCEPCSEVVKHWKGDLD